ncbi:hypothetical protein AAG570_000919 [Ranatra chinensis]|uniref:Uncharacterized protein n=1 Tax=Ranatra chinensis TaxID=642074 RepID=A0ABD0ZJQ3_9HEMI
MSKFRVYCWGLAEHGALGLKGSKSSSTSFRYIPKPVRHSFAEEKKVVAVACGFGFTAFGVQALDRYKVFGNGINTDSQIGLHEPRKNHPLSLVLAPAPINLGLEYSDTSIVSMSAGRAHLAVVTDKEGVFTLGSNCYGQCGREIIENEKYNGSHYVHNITKLGNEKVTSVSCGQDHTLFLTASGKVFSCGWSADGQTGTDQLDNICEPTRIDGDIKGETIIKVTGKSDCNLALSSNGEVFGWGNNEYFQLDTESKEQQVNCPRRLMSLQGLGKIVDIASGGPVCMALNECGDVFVWGYGILGVGPRIEMSGKPLQIPPTLFGRNEFQPETRVISVSCGLTHFMAINNHHNLYSWGRNRAGCLGIGHTRDQYFPYKVALSAHALSVSCGMDHTMVICRPFS